ncbi:MAG TPA: isoprenylcysteine carboxylmethyltransferase family protein [Melioribacteraceae bacterium]|nr:isoprenylcysteine carboxylmethyltransferase family protein [Melioribacteraceae bacterium]
MSYFWDVLLIILLFSIFAFSHSVFASLWFKNLLAKSIGSKIAFYRLFYNFISLLIFMAVYYLMPKPDVIIYDLQFPYDLIILGLQFLSLFGLVYTGFKINGKEFLGLSQIKRYVQGNYDINDLDEKMELRIDGIFSFTRHPIYLFSILFWGLRPYMDLFYFVFFICLTIYFYIGAFFEEKKLVKLFGDSYLEYKKRVPSILPIKFK